MHKGLHLFIAGLSGRALAQAAHELGIRCTVADCFGDADTQAYAQQCFNVASAEEGLCIDAAKLSRALERCALELGAGGRQGKTLVVLTGTGFESHLGTLDQLHTTAKAVDAHCAFNAPAVLSAVTDPLQFFAVLDENHIPHPLTQLTPPTASQTWLIKQRGGHGAAHIRPFTGRAQHADQDIYYQEVIVGCEHSLCFAAQYDHVYPLGFNQQWIERMPEGGYRYRGAVGATAAVHGLSASIEATMLKAASTLCARFEVCGLASLDFIVRDEVAYVLELNARPTASFELFDRAAALAAHLRAFGVAIEAPPRRVEIVDACAAHRYVFTPNAVTISAPINAALAHLGVASHITDWPVEGMTVPGESPLCNLHATGQTPVQAEARLDVLEETLWFALASMLASPMNSDKLSDASRSQRKAA
jgi:predicted ATP-grasp superfamily ATP-dependent carboligase